MSGLRVLAIIPVLVLSPSGWAGDDAQARVVAGAQGVLDGLVERGIPGASAALVLPDGSLVTIVAGLADDETATAMTPEHRLLSGSVGKTYVTGAAHLLVESGQLDLDERAVEYLTDESREAVEAVPNGDAVTLRQLLRHRSGIPRYVFKPAFARELVADVDRRWRPEELLGFVAGDDPLFAPGEGFAYSDTNYIIVGLVIEAVAGTSYYDFVRERILVPRELLDTVPTDRRDVDDMAQGTVVLGASLVGVDRALDDGVFAYNPQFEWCGGGFACTPADLARWTRVLYAGELMEADYLDALLDGVDAPELGPGMRYGLGAMMTDTAVGPSIGHDGFMPGYLTTTAYFPDVEIAGAIQLNSDDMGKVGRRLSAVLVELVEIAGEDLREEDR